MFLKSITLKKQQLSLNKQQLRAAVTSHFPDTVSELMEQLYVDDYLGGKDKVETAKTRVDETNTLFREVRFNMRS
jgi:hypothetical protein